MDLAGSDPEALEQLQPGTPEFAQSQHLMGTQHSEKFVLHFSGNSLDCVFLMFLRHEFTQ